MPKKRVVRPAAPATPKTSKASEATPGPSARGRKHKPTPISQLPETLWKLAVKYRWQEAPLVALVLVFWAGSGPGFGAALTGASAALLYFSRTRGTIGGRMYLSERERQVAALWLAVASLWQLLTLVPFWERPGRVELAILVAMQVFPSYQWWGCRRPPRPKKLSAKSTERLALWSLRIAVKDGVLKGSAIDRSTVTEPVPEVLSFEVELREDVHNADASTDTSRKAIESGLKLPSDCVQVTALRTKSSRIKVVLAPVRTLEVNTVKWPLAEPLISPLGILPLSRTDEGQAISIQKWGKDGVKHGRGCGNSGTGKSGVIRCLALPGIEACSAIADA